MDSKTYDEFFEAYQNGEDISKYMPTRSWKDSLEEQPQKRLK